MHAVGSASPRTMRLISGSVSSLLGMHVGALLSAKRAVYSVPRLRAGAVRKSGAARFLFDRGADAQQAPQPTVPVRHVRSRTFQSTRGGDR